MDGKTPEKTNIKQAIPQEEFRSMIKTEISQVKGSADIKKDIGKALVKIFERGTPPKEALGLTDLDISEMYCYGFTLFSSGKYTEAREIFKLLIQFCPEESDFYICLGVCHHRLKAYQLACACYMGANQLNPSNPVPLFYAYDCCLNVEDPYSAAIMLANGLVQCGNDPKYAKMKEKGKLQLEALEKQLGEKIMNDDARRELCL